jgi:hypothetical protein
MPRVQVSRLSDVVELSDGRPTARMAAIAGDFGRILGGFAIRTAVLAVIPGLACTTRMCTFLPLVVSHLYLLRGARFTSVRRMVRGRRATGDDLELHQPSFAPSFYLWHGKWQRSRSSPLMTELHQLVNRREVCKAEAHTSAWDAGLWPAPRLPGITDACPPRRHGTMLFAFLYASQAWNLLI